jgi:glutathione peroxidase-family protein
MPSKYVLAIAVVAVFAVAGFWVRNIFAKDIVHDPTTMPTQGSTTRPASPLDFAVKDIDGKDVNLSDYRGKVVMIVNVASKCGFTPQYTALEAMYKKYADQGFVIIGFPANNFHSQEPGTDADIKAFCTSKYEVTFPMMSKISVKGADKAPLYKFLTEPVSAGDFTGEIGWNFTKFIVDRNGNVIARFASATKPTDEKLVGIVEKALAVK